MAGKLRNWRGIWGTEQGARGRKADMRVAPVAPVAPARRWALGLMIMASASALLATSDPNGSAGLYSFEKSSEVQQAVLTQSAPLARHVVRVRVTGLGPEGADTTESAQAVVHGTLQVFSTTVGASPFVRVRLQEGGQISDEVSAATSFQLSQALRFSGNCAHPEEGSPCEAEIGVEFDAPGSTLLQAEDFAKIDWQVDVSSRAFRRDGSEKDAQPSAPWTIEVVAP